MRIRSPEAKRRMGDVLGEIIPGAMYDTDAVMSVAGIGEVKLRDERKAGRLKWSQYNGRNWYRGADLIQLIENNSK